MSQEAVIDFFEAVSQNEQLQERLMNIIESSENDREDVATFASESGYEITADELWAEIQKRQADFSQRQEAGELSDEELEAVAGGEFVATAMSIFAVTAFTAGQTILLTTKVKW
ncbi:Nif11-like leader peptide family natural product precursor [Cyanobacterium aponinum UTEX 3222]|uniref:Nif11-like leader peptide family natural product precursor n=1 Tax=Cyanobacterium aponinum TaxID=379064 RepID=UPI002B4BFEE9|nr:Nif11-like leader peptide family natural product precursor [Cyanobacterium aponinum]WRL37683.1 Nif11-like leader peptide family natural product precursor [Cyanobacterium aponinum UTEX 3221]WRL41848.1 Nif11-like leader peptide family natural product precursor [Cyanobacterium aponinum UTEX 3222]